MSPAKGRKASSSKRSGKSEKAAVKSKNKAKAGASAGKVAKAAKSSKDDAGVAIAEKLAGILEAHGLSEVLVERDNLTVRVRRQATAMAAPAMAMAAPAQSSGGAASAGPVGEALDGHIVTSPFVGTFYLAANPDSDPYVSKGQQIEKGDVLCIVEAMKLMNEIEADVSGEILEVLVKNAEPVEYGQALFRIDPA